MSIEKKIDLARRTSFQMKLLRGAELGARLLKEDLATPDLAAGGAAAPQQGAPSPMHPKKPHGTVVKTIDWQGMPVHIDRPYGYVQQGIDPSGTAWKRYYHTDYGFVPNTQGGDAEGLDVYVGLNKEATDAHWVKQKKADGTFDEYKVMLGFGDADMAKGMYLAHTPKKFFGGMATTSVAMMKALLGLHPTETMKALAAFAVDTIGAQVEGHKEEKNVRLIKGDVGDPEQRYTLGIVLEPETTDAQGDVYSAEAIRLAAWGYMTNFRNVGLMHKGLVNGRVELVESYIAPIDMNVGGSQIKAGTWLLGLHIPDDQIWDQVKKGGLTGLSIGGFAKKTPVVDG